MAAFFGSPPIFSLPTTRIYHISSSSQTPPPNPTPQPEPEPPTSSSSQLSTSYSEESGQEVSAKTQQQKPIKPTTKVESTDWIATNLTRRFGLGAGLAWVAFLAFGVISEQIKTRLEVSQQEANTRSLLSLSN